MNDEELKEIVGFPNYVISNTGKIFNKKTTKKLKTYYNKNGYENVYLSNNNNGKVFLLHRLVALTFIEDINEKVQVHHIDHDRSNNCLSNLMWVTPKENSDFKLKKKEQKISRGEFPYLTKTKICEIYKMKKWKNVDEFYKELLKF